MDSAGGPQLHALMTQMAEDSSTDTAAIAVAWLLAHPANILPVMGTNTLSRIATLADALKIKMSRQAWYQLYTTALGHEVA